jgi:hypothetical protein
VRSAAVISAVFVSSVVVMAGASWASAESTGVRPASSRVIAEIVRDLGLPQPSRCYGGSVARSQSRWVAIGVRHPVPAGCQGVDGYGIVRKTGGTWRDIKAGGSRVPCRTLRSSLASAGAPPSVFRDFKSAWLCSPEA